MILRRQVQASYDDAWKRITPSYWTKTFAILYVGDVSAGTNKQMGGAMRFLDITIPRGATITHAYLTLTSEDPTSGSTIRTRIKGQAADNPPTFSTLVDFDARSWTSQVDWDDIPAWTLNQRYHSPDIKTVIQEIVDRPGWSSGNAMVLCWDDFDGRSDTGAYRQPRAYDSVPARAPELTIIYDLALEIPVSASSDDCRRSYGPADWWALTDDNALVGYHTATYSLYGAGLRFTNIAIPRGAIITEAYLKMQAYSNQAVDTVNSRIRAQAHDNPPTFTTKTEFDARAWGAAVDWDEIEHWTTDTWYTSPDIKTCIQAVVDRPGWTPGNAIALAWDDFDDRSTHVASASRYSNSYDKGAAIAPILLISYTPPPHIALGARYITASADVNRAYVIGRDAEGNPVHGTSVTQAEVDLVGERLDFHQLLSIPTGAEAEDVAEAMLATQRIRGSRGFIQIPPNCGAELWDVVQLTDELCAQAAATYRIAGIRTEYQPKEARYHQTLYLAAP